MSSHNKALLSSAAVWGMMAALVLLILTACTTGTPGLGDQAGTTSLPTGLRMLTASNAECSDSVHVGSGSVANARLGPELFVQPGQNATYQVSGTPVYWACMDGDDADFNQLGCAEETAYVRFTRSQDGEELLLECYG